MKIFIVVLTLLSFFYSISLAQTRKVRIDGVADNVILDEAQKEELKTLLKGIISIRLTPARNDYVDNFNRGTVEYNPYERNYSYQKVIIPDGTIITGKNFTQANAHTVTIIGKNLTFKDCQMINVEVDPSWTLVNSSNYHIRRKEIVKNGRTYEITEKDTGGIWNELVRQDITPDPVP